MVGKRVAHLCQMMPDLQYRRAVVRLKRAGVSFGLKRNSRDEVGNL